MKINAYLFVNQRGQLRITKKDSSAYPTELAMHVVIDVPNSFFNRPIPVVNIQVPDFMLVDPDAEAMVKFVAPEVAEALKLEVKTVQDGLVTLLKAKQEEGKTE